MILSLFYLVTARCDANSARRLARSPGILRRSEILRSPDENRLNPNDHPQGSHPARHRLRRRCDRRACVFGCCRRDRHSRPTTLAKSCNALPNASSLTPGGKLISSSSFYGLHLPGRDRASNHLTLDQQREKLGVGAIASVFPASAWQGRCAGFLTIEAYIFMKRVEIVALALIRQYGIPRLCEVLWVDDCDAIFKRITILQSKVLG